MDRSRLDASSGRRIQLDRRTFLRVGSILMGSALLSACGSDAGDAGGQQQATRETAGDTSSAAPTSVPSDSASPAAISDKPITIVMGTEIETLDPHQTGVRNTQIATEAIYNGLVTRDTENQIVPDLAIKWEVSDDSLAWTFTLDPEAKFSDGTPVTADAVRFSIERILNPETKSNSARLLAMIDRVEVQDETTVDIMTKYPFAPLLANLSDPGPKILQPEAVERWGADYGQHPVGSGPFMLKEWIVGQHVILEPNPHYHGSDKPRNSQIILRAAKEGGARAAALESGQADLVTNLPPEAIDRVRGNHDLEVLVAPSSFLIFFVLDHGREPFNDVRVRMAANYAVDRDAIVDTILGGLGEPATSPLGNGVLGRAEFAQWPYDPERAKALLAEAGYPDGCPVEMWVPEGRYLKDRQVGEAVQSYLQKAGFEPNLTVLEWGVYQVEVFKSPPEPNMWLIGASIPDAHWNLANNFRTNGYYPNSYSNPRVDELLEQAGKTFDDAERNRIYEEIQRIIYEEDAVMLYLHGQRQVLGHKKSLRGVAPRPYEIFPLTLLEMT